MTDDEKRGYSKGYAAGMRRIEREFSNALSEHRRSEFQRQVFLAILPELVRSPWQVNGKTWDTIPQFVDGAWKFAECAAKKTSFSGEVFTPHPGDKK